MTERWWYTRGGEREGPVPRERLVDLVRAGWLGPRDLVWSEGMPDWVPAGSLDWLCGSRVQRTVTDLLDAARHPERHPLAPVARRRPRRPLVDWDRVAIRHLVAAAGAITAALGAAFTLIAPSALGFWLLLGGAIAFVAGLHVELGPHVRRLAALAARAASGAMHRWLGGPPASIDHFNTTSAAAPTHRPAPVDGRDYDDRSGP